VRVGSLNAAKLEAVRRGLAPFFDPVEVKAHPARSQVSDQPLGFEEILAGARTRARQSYAAGNCDLGAGIEDGLLRVPGTSTGHMNVGFCVLYDGKEEAVGMSAGFEYPAACVEAATGSKRVPVGKAFDEVFQPPPGWEDPGPGAGNIGRLTRGALTRADYSAQAVICAVVRRLHPSLYRSHGT
jgi:inosine/xanthosine triphosphatase